MDKRDYAIDFIRLVSIIAVVVIHTSTYFLDVTRPFTFTFYFLHAINQLVRFAVPLFFAISGFLLAKHYQNIPGVITFYKRRLSKILVPYFFWSLIYFLIIFPNPINLVFSRIFLHDLITGDSSYQLYFIPAIFLLYIIFPLIIRSKKIFLTGWFIILLGIVETALMSYVYFFEPKIGIISPIPNAIYNFFPFILGIFAALKINDFKDFLKKKINIFKFISAALFIIIFSESIFMFAATGKPMYLRDQWRISVMLYGVSTGALFYYFYQERWNKTVNYLSGFSFGVFFVHAAILHNMLIIFYKFKLYDLGSFIISLALTIALSFLFSILFSKIGVLNKLLGLRS